MLMRTHARRVVQAAAVVAMLPLCSVYPNSAGAGVYTNPITGSPEIDIQLTTSLGYCEDPSMRPTRLYAVEGVAYDNGSRGDMWVVLMRDHASANEGAFAYYDTRRGRAPNAYAGSFNFANVAGHTASCTGGGMSYTQGCGWFVTVDGPNFGAGPLRLIQVANTGSSDVNAAWHNTYFPNVASTAYQPAGGAAYACASWSGTKCASKDERLLVVYANGKDLSSTQLLGRIMKTDGTTLYGPFVIEANYSNPGFGRAAVSWLTTSSLRGYWEVAYQSYALCPNGIYKAGHMKVARVDFDTWKSCSLNSDCLSGYCTTLHRCGVTSSPVDNGVCDGASCETPLVVGGDGEAAPLVNSNRECGMMDIASNSSYLQFMFANGWYGTTDLLDSTGHYVSGPGSGYGVSATNISSYEFQSLMCGSLPSIARYYQPWNVGETFYVSNVTPLTCGGYGYWQPMLRKGSATSAVVFTAGVGVTCQTPGQPVNSPLYLTIVNNS